jgi:Cu/Ag efflux pump CusA
VIGGLLFATVATLIFVPAVFSLLHSGEKQKDVSGKRSDQHMTAGA